MIMTTVISQDIRVEAGVDFSFLGIKFFGRLQRIDKSAGFQLLAVSRQPIHLSALLKNVLGDDASLPGELNLPELIIDHLMLSIGQNGDCEFSCLLNLDCGNYGQNPDNVLEGVPLAVNSLGVKLYKRADGSSGGLIELNTGEVKFNDDFIIERFTLIFTTDAKAMGRRWSFGGSADAVISGQSLTLAMAYSQGEQNQLRFHYENKSGALTTLVHNDDVGSVKFSELTLSLVRDRNTNKDNRATTYRLDAKGRIELGQQLLIIDGHMTAALTTNGNFKLECKPSDATEAIQLTEAKSLPVTFDRIVICRIAEGKTASWDFDIKTTFNIESLIAELPAVIQSGGSLPTSIKTNLKGDKQGIRFTLDHAPQPINIPMPATDTHRQYGLEPGVLSLQIEACSVVLAKSHKNRAVSLELTASVGLPTELNSLLGVSDEGKPNYMLFNTYDIDKPKDNLVRFRLGVGTKGVTLRLLSSPIRAIDLQERAGKTWWDWDFGEFGAASLQLPELSYQPPGEFAASGGFEITKDLALPLTPVKTLLESMGCKSLADFLPDKQSLADVSFLDDNNRLKTDSLTEMIVTGFDSVFGGGENFKSFIGPYIESLAGMVDRLPTEFKDYLHFRIPKKLDFAVSSSLNGMIDFSLSTPKDSPIRLLFPAMMGPYPALQGITLRSISFGMAAGGALAIVKADLVIDFFDLQSLCTVMYDEKRSFQQRIIIDDLLMIVVLATGIPIPVPVFYNQLAIEFNTINGAELRSHIKFPNPAADITGIFGIFSGLYAEFNRLYQNPGAELNPDALGESDLCFSLADCYLKLPDYLGGRVIGYQGPEYSIKAYNTIATVINNARNFSLKSFISETITNIPTEYRSGSEAIEFGPFGLQISWLLSNGASSGPSSGIPIFDTPELRVLTKELLTDTPSGMPQHVETSFSKTNGDDNLVILLHGKASLMNWCDYQVGFVLMESALRFNTAFCISATIANSLQMGISGKVAINGNTDDGSSASFVIEGNSFLALGANRIFDGTVRLSDEQFFLSGQLDLFPGNPRIKLGGHVTGLISKREFLLEGGITGRVDELTLLDMQVHFSQQRLYCSATVLSAHINLDIDASKQTLNGNLTLSLLNLLHFDATLSISAAGAQLTGDIDTAVVMYGNEIIRAKATAQLMIRNNLLHQAKFLAEINLCGVTRKAMVAVTQSDFTFAITGTIFNMLEAELSVQGSNDKAVTITATVTANGLSQCQTDAKTIVDQQVERYKELDRIRKQVESDRANAEKRIQAAQREVDTWNQRIKEIERDIDEKEKYIQELNKNGYYNSVGLWVYNDWGTTRAKVTKCRGEIAAMNTEWGARCTSLKAAKLALEGARKLCKYASADLDPRVIGTRVGLGMQDAYDSGWATMTALTSFPVSINQISFKFIYSQKSNVRCAVNIDYNFNSQQQSTDLEMNLEDMTPYKIMKNLCSKALFG